MKRPWILLGILGALLVAGAVLSGPSTGDSGGPHGTLALRRYLGAMGLTVRDGATPPDVPGVFVLLTDLRDADQAGDLVSWARAFGTGVFGAGGPVVFGPPLPPGAAGPKGLVGSLPAGARIVLFQIALAAVIFAFVRGRRFGRPTFEEIPSPVPSGELVHAVARLYRSARARAFAGDALRRGTRRRLRSRLGLGPEPPAAGNPPAAVP